MAKRGQRDNETPDEDIGEVGPVQPPPEKRIRLAPEEFVRALLALIFAAMLAGTGAWAFIEIHSPDWANVKSLLDTLVPAESALLGSAVGFYFGTKK
jgi:hypothetical protein